MWSFLSCFSRCIPILTLGKLLRLSLEVESLDRRGAQARDLPAVPFDKYIDGEATSLTDVFITETQSAILSLVRG